MDPFNLELVFELDFKRLNNTTTNKNFKSISTSNNFCLNTLS
jgi:hypothetical protein